MKVVLVGAPRHRARLREQLALSDVDIIGEADSLTIARAAHRSADAFIVGRTSGAGDAGDDSATIEALTPREMDVLAGLAEGMSNKAIAAHLGISDQTVKFHVASICGKLGAQNRTDAVRLAIQRGIIAV